MAHLQEALQENKRISADYIESKQQELSKLDHLNKELHDELLLVRAKCDHLEAANVKLKALEYDRVEVLQ